MGSAGEAWQEVRFASERSAVADEVLPLGYGHLILGKAFHIRSMALPSLKKSALHICVRWVSSRCQEGALLEHKLVYYDNFPVCETQVLLSDTLERPRPA